MSLRRSTDLLPVLALLAALLLGGCATPGKRDAANDDPSASVPPQVLTQYEQAVAVMASGDAIEAELRFAEFVLRYPDYPGAYVNLAILRRGSGNLEQAEESLDAALSLEPMHIAALNQLGMLRRQQGRFDEAEDAYLRALAADPDYALAHYNLAVLNELYLQRLQPALDHFQKYQSLGGDDDTVERWIVDLERRIAANQRTANVTE